MVTYKKLPGSSDKLKVDAFWTALKHCFGSSVFGSSVRWWFSRSGFPGNQKKCEGRFSVYQATLFGVGTQRDNEMRTIGVGHLYHVLGSGAGQLYHFLGSRSGGGGASRLSVLGNRICIGCLWMKQQMQKLTGCDRIHKVEMLRI